MRCHLALVPLVLAALALPAWALLMGVYRSADHIARARNLLVVQVPEPPPNTVPLLGKDGVIDCRVEVLKVLAGSGAEAGKDAVVSTLARLRPGARYLLAGEEAGRAGKPWLLFHWHLGVTEIPDSFDLKTLEEKPVKDQVALILKARVDELDRRLESLRAEKQSMEKALAAD